MTDRWTDRLSEYLDDELTPEDGRTLEAHLADCAECRTTLADLRRVVARAGSLTPRPPAADLWPGIEPHLHGGAANVVTRTRRAPWRISFTLPELVAAGLALMVLSGGAVWIGQHGGRATSLPPVSATSADYDQAVADLERALQNGRSGLDPETAAVIEQNVRAIDRAIEQSREALEQDPANIYLNNHLAKARQRKLALLRQATALASTKGS